MAQLINEAKRMQRLAGIITENEYVSSLEENLWDRVKDKAKQILAKFKGGQSALVASAFKDGGLDIGRWAYFTEHGEMNRIMIKSIDYNSGASTIIFQKKDKDGKYVTDEKESLLTKLGFEEDISKLKNKSEEELKKWYDKNVDSIKDQLGKGEMAYNEEDVKKSLNKAPERKYIPYNAPFSSDNPYQLPERP
jgi:hypothetical protein